MNNLVQPVPSRDSAPEARGEALGPRLSLVPKPAVVRPGGADNGAQGPERMFAHLGQAPEVLPHPAPRHHSLRGARAAAKVVKEGIDLWEEIRLEVTAGSRAPETRRSYAHHEKAYTKWCRESGVEPWQATPREVARHLASYFVARDEQGNPLRDDKRRPVPEVSASALRQRLAAIDLAFEREGGSRPGRDREVKEFMMGMRRLVGVAPRFRKAGIVLKDLRRIATLALCPDPVVVRDRLMGKLHHAHEATPGQLARLDWTDIEVGDAGGDSYVWLPRDRPGGARRKVRLRGAGDLSDAVLLRLLKAATSGDGGGPVFTRTDGVRLTRQGIHKHLRTAGGDNPPVTVGLEPSLKMVRDRAVVCVGWFAALRRSNLSLLRWSDLTWLQDGDVRLYLRRSKTDQEGEGCWNTLPRLPDDPACPVVALEEWRARVTATLGEDPMTATPEAFVFVPVDKHGQLGSKVNAQLSGHAINELVQELAEAAGLVAPGPDPDPEGKRSRFGGHSMRRGFVTEALTTGKLSFAQVQQITHHGDPRSVATYHEAVDGAMAADLRRVVATATS